MKSQISSVLAFATALGLSGCASNPEVTRAETPAQQASQLSGKQFKFNLDGGVPRKISGAADPLMGYEGLADMYASFGEHCVSASGNLEVEERVLVGPRAVPSRLSCRNGNETLWSIEIQYDNVRTSRVTNFGDSTWLFLTPKAQLVSKENILEARRKRVEGNKKASENAEQTERIEAPKRAAREAAESAAIDSFRKGLRAGDMFTWIEPNRKLTIYGLVVRVEGELVFVQFENLQIGGSNVRYVGRKELKPWNGIRTNTRYQLE